MPTLQTVNTTMPQAVAGKTPQAVAGSIVRTISRSPSGGNPLIPTPLTLVKTSPTLIIPFLGGREDSTSQTLAEHSCLRPASSIIEMRDSSKIHTWRRVLLERLF
eukprot:2237297-Rhodomonas_salina.1